MKDKWLGLSDDARLVLSIVGVTLLLAIGGATYRVVNGQPLIKRETASEKEKRLHSCAEVWGTTPTHSQRTDTEYQGICSGFTQEDIDSLEPAPVESQPPTAEEILNLMNEERTKIGVAPLVMNERVRQSAQLKAVDMVANDYFQHEIPGTGKVLSPAMDALLSASCTYSGENIFWAKYDKTQTAVDWWMNSPPHKAAMLDPKFTAIGIGVSDWRYVAHFCIAK